ncbi:AAA domain-containing protein [Bacillus sp. UNCCL81]|uniref:AAA domain-containing protein n=1 Tax=Bacillus sp. UNCCL81 TaxID=1502755 RepID=UPI0008E882AD|nr:AAA domain-containing protein [Bacillus sp. UNCCL81]SFC94983.1 Superfamily I DNA and/or RNA helicase [Bacillus sp. UNCCL81]
MNDDKDLILIKNMDKTEEIEFCELVKDKFEVKYRNSSKSYCYNSLNVCWYKDPKVYDPKKWLVYENNSPVNGVFTILDFGEYIKLKFQSGYKKLYKKSEIYIEETSLKNSSSKNIFEYLNKLGGQISVRDEREKSFLSQQYSKLEVISPRSVLSTYIEKKSFIKKDIEANAIFPFGFNQSQKYAAEKALNNQISVIEGPPGTGKTQTILNIIANAILNDKTVAVVSNNNSATANVLEKLQRYEIDFIAAYLGNNENKAKFLAEQNSILPNMNGWKMPIEEFELLKTELISSQKKLNEMLSYRNKQALLKQELSNIRTENEYFNQYYKETVFENYHFKSISKLNSDKILKLLIEYKQKSFKGKITLTEKLSNLLIYGVYDFKIYSYPPEQTISYLQKNFYEKKIKEINIQLNGLTKTLENYNFENEMKEYSRRSMDLFKAKLAMKYSGSNRSVFQKGDLWNNFNKFANEYPVILSTTHSLLNSTGKNYLFDYVIVDEASQVDIVTGALALAAAKNAVIVGDTKQLANVVTKEVATITNNIFNSYGLEEAYNYTTNSLLSSFLTLFEDIPKTLLKEHYRCHPKIIGFCNQKFYNNELIVMTDEEDLNKPLVLYKTSKGNHARERINQRQIEVIFDEIIPEQKIDEGKQSVGIISPYRLQAEELSKVAGHRKIQVDTVHKFQGREKDVIILSTVANKVKAEDFVDDPNLINVAVSRAVDKLIVVASDGGEEWKGTNIGDLVRYIQYNNFEVIESKIYSVFDLLYSSYSDKLLDTLKKTKNVSKYKSENIMNVVISDILSLPEYQNLSYVMHQPLRMLIRDPFKLTDEEAKYAMNILTHTDFLIFNKVDKMPILVVEVDGYAFHANNPTQLKRDRMKDEILNKYDIPIIRLKTNESREDERLRLKLMDVIR